MAICIYIAVIYGVALFHTYPVFDVESISGLEYQLYSDVFNVDGEIIGDPIVLIGDSTIKPPRLYPLRENDVHARNDSMAFYLTSGMMDNFNIANSQRSAIRDRFHLPYRYELFNATGNIEEGIANIRDKYPQFRGIVKFSRAGFNHSNDRAVFYVSWSHAGHGQPF